MNPAGEPRYDRVAIALHWAIGLALLGQIAFGFALDTIAPRGTPARTGVVNLHKSTGIVLGALIVLRLAWRLRHAPPPWTGHLSALQQRAARIGHRALYACMVVMPLSGYVASNFSRHGVRFFGRTWAPWGPDLPSVYAFFNGVHVVTAFVFATLVLGHVAVSLWHAFVRRDGVFARIWPRPSRPSASRALDPAAPTP
jgi:cytochrome b561